MSRIHSSTVKFGNSFVLGGNDAEKEAEEKAEQEVVSFRKIKDEILQEINQLEHNI